MSSIDLNEYQELKKRIRRKGHRQSRFRRYALIFLIIAAFQLGIIGGVILSRKTPQKPELLGHKTNNQQSAVATAPQPMRIPAGTMTKAPPSVPVTNAPGKPVGEEVSAKPVEDRKRSAIHERASRKRRDHRAVPATARAVMPPISIDVAGGDIGRAYAAGMRTIIERHKEQSPVVNGLSAGGRSIVICIIKRDGSLRHAEVVRSSGNASVDDAALRSVYKAGKFPRVPENIPGDEFSFDVPLTFKVR